jgi:hypothetical protein
MEKAQTCRGVESGNWVDSQRHPGGATDKGCTVFSKTPKSTSNGGRLADDPERRSAGSLDQLVEPPSRAHPPKRGCAYFVWGMRSGHALDANHGPRSLSANVFGLLIGLGSSCLEVTNLEVTNVALKQGTET